ncbi:MAG: hypothetical protein FWG85_04385 [Bacteroidetes bacterium]|nr:hypothetical protein [Bacteroidota bacterium]
MSSPCNTRGPGNNANKGKYRASILLEEYKFLYYDKLPPHEYNEGLEQVLRHIRQMYWKIL